MTTEEAKRIIEEVVSSDDYKHEVTEIPDWITKVLTWAKGIVDKVFKWIADKLEDLFKKLNLNLGGSGDGGGVLETIGIILVCILGAALLFVIVVLILKILKHAGKRQKKEESDAEELVRLSEMPDEAMNLYEKYLAEGNLREAFRYLFISMLVQLNKRELITIRKYKTNRVYKSEILNLGLYDAEITDKFFTLFNFIRYGNASISAEELETMHTHYVAILESADRKTVKKQEKGGEEA